MFEEIYDGFNVVKDYNHCISATQTDDFLASEPTAKGHFSISPQYSPQRKKSNSFNRKNSDEKKGPCQTEIIDKKDKKKLCTQKISEVLPALETSLEMDQKNLKPISLRMRRPNETPVAAAKKTLFSMKEKRPNLQSLKITFNPELVPSPCEVASIDQRRFSTFKTAKTIKIYK